MSTIYCGSRAVKILVGRFFFISQAIDARRFLAVGFLKLNTMLNEISQIVKDLIGNEYLYFDEALQIKTSPHTFPVNLWAVCVNPNNSVYVMDGQENWFPLSEKDEIVIQSLYQRVQMIASKYKTAI